MSDPRAVPRQFSRDDRVRVRAHKVHAGRVGTVVNVSEPLPYPVSVNFDDDFESTYAFKHEELERV